MTTPVDRVPPLIPLDMKCYRCHGDMKQGIALVPTFIGTPDFACGEVVTVSPGGPGRIVECMKCVVCGFSLTKPLDIVNVTA